MSFKLTSQEEEKKIVTEKLTVTKSFTPELNKVNKIRSKVTDKDIIKTDKMTVKYSLLDVPVISTFKPNKASPLKLKRNFSEESNHNSQFNFGLGNRDQLVFDLTSHVNLNRNERLGFDLINNNYGSIKNTLTPSDQNLFVFGIQHSYSSQKVEVLNNLELNQMNSYYYGIYNDVSTLSDPILLSNVETFQKRTSFTTSSNWKWYNGFVKEALFKYRSSKDSFDSAENFISLNAVLSFPIFGSNFLISPQVSSIDTSFSEGYFDRLPMESFYSKAQTAFQLSNIINNFKYKIGGTINYMFNQSNELTPELFFSPKIFLSYGQIGERFLPYLTLDGGLDFNRYFSLSLYNPYLAPTLNLIPTQTIFSGEVGFKSFFDSGVEFRFATHFKQQDNAPFFVRYPYDPSVINQGYRLANSFGLEYDNLFTYGILTEFSYDFNDDNLIRFSFAQFNYETENIDHPWNLPDFEGNLSLGIKIQKKIRFNLSGRYIGVRPSAYRNVFPNLLPENSPISLDLVPGIFQLKTEVNYRYNKDWQIYIRNNINNSSSNSIWAYYPLNQNLFLAGLRYSFALSL
ncbi:MAG: hypothetical protein CMC79_02900 [Flavobacteriaceae bacterium]|nr:hypothetical protein [Flavobacteriaceae bacterium]|tara:strand:+ start:20179 stop:21891 length:1713 start_codon:yes stop_codon:yes gene_type:complete